MEDRRQYCKETALFMLGNANAVANLAVRDIATARRFYEGTLGLTPVDHEGDDFVATFQIEDTSVRGRIARLGDGVLDPIIKRHDYPRWAAHLLGEAITLAVLVSASLKFDGKVLVQAQGEGPVSLMVAARAAFGAWSRSTAMQSSNLVSIHICRNGLQ